jgi:hypothetical protein
MKWQVTLPGIAFGFFALFYLGDWYGYATGGDGPGKEMGAEMLGIPCLILFGVATLASLVVTGLCARTKGRIVWGLFPAAHITFAILLSEYGPPDTTVTVDYLGPRSSIFVEISTHGGESGFELKPGVLCDVSMGQGLRQPYVEWSETFGSPRKRADFDLRRQIPKYGRNRAIHIHVFDTNATCEVD